MAGDYQVLACEYRVLEQFCVFVKIFVQCFCNHAWGPEMTWAFVKRPPFYPVRRFQIFQALVENFAQVAAEVQHVGRNTNAHISRPKSIWTGTGRTFADAHAKTLQGWVPGWNGHEGESKHDKWWNYPLLFEQREFTQNTLAVPTLQAWLRTHGRYLNVVGLSWFRPGAKLQEHTDSTGLLRGSLSFHLCLSGPSDGSCWLRVQNHNVCHVPGRALVFDSSMVHQAANDHASEDRVILYVDFQVPWSLCLGDNG